MEGNFRNALIIISAIVIGAIFIHGLWTIRKNKNPYKLKAKKTKVENFERGFDQSGFDQDGVSRARVVDPESILSDEETPDIPAPAPEYSEDPIPKDLEKPARSDIELEPTGEALFDSDDLAPVDTIDKPKQQSVYQEPVIHAKPRVTIEKPVRSRQEKRPQNAISWALILMMVSMNRYQV